MKDIGEKGKRGNEQLKNISRLGLRGRYIAVFREPFQLVDKRKEEEHKVQLSHLFN